MGDITDDLSDIYIDLKEPLVLYQQGHVKEAVWSWRLMFYSYWGHHAVGGLKALHSVIARG